MKPIRRIIHKAIPMLALLGWGLLSSCSTPFQSPCSYRFMLVPTQKQADELSQNRNLRFSCREART